MKLPEDQLQALRLAKKNSDIAAQNVAHSTLKAKKYNDILKADTDAFGLAYDKFGNLQGAVIREYGKAISIDLATGEIIKPEQDAGN